MYTIYFYGAIFSDLQWPITQIWPTH